MKQQVRNSLVRGIALATFCAAVCAVADDISWKDTERSLINVLRSDAPEAEKAITCKKLVIYGTDEAVPALAPLLLNERLESWARIALEAIPGDAAESALRDALPKVQGRQRVGVINSLGVRRDQEAVDPLVDLLADKDADVASASAVALGKIGGEDAAKSLRQALRQTTDDVRPAVAEGAVLCAEQFRLGGRESAAAGLYDLVRKADVPRQRILDATRGYILARGEDAIPLLLELLRSDDKGLLAIGLSTARELPGSKATKALAAELEKAGPERQPLLLLALADRGDATALPAILSAARTGSTQLRTTAVGVLERLGNVSTVPVLLDISTSPDANLAQAGKVALTRLPGAEVDEDLQHRLGAATGKERQVILELVGRRQIQSAMPVVMASMRNTDPGVRTAAVEALGLIGTAKQAGEVAQALGKAATPAEKSELESALLSICSRNGADSVPPLLTLAKDSKPEMRIIALHALASAGGTQALNAVKSGLKDSDSEVQDEAVRTLTSWPNTWPDDRDIAEPLVSLAKSADKTSHQVLALRGYLQYLQSNRDLKDAEKVKKIDEILPLMRRPEEKRLAIPILQPIAVDDSLDILVNFAGDNAVAEDACSAILKMASARNQSLSKEQKQKALELVAEKGGSEATRNRAQRMLNELKR